MKNRPSGTILTLGAGLCVSLVAVGAIGASAGSVYADTASNSSSANASITISPTIHLTLSGGDLVINDLVPGSTADSNVITASVTTNSASGYFLSATTGTASTNTDLTHNTNDTYKFTNLDSNKASLSNFNDNTWGYSYSIDNGTNWISGDNGTATTGYNGLPLDNDDSGATGIKLLSTDTYSQTGSIKFKIGAKASSTQASGTYTGVVNFYAVTNPEPTPYLQDLTSTKLNQLLPNIGDVTIAIDKRDEQIYRIARLADNKYWMVENLNLAGGTVLSADDTDVTSAYISSFSTSNNLTRDGNTIILPVSSDADSEFYIPNYSYVHNSGNKVGCGSSGQEDPCYSYYSWDAATLGSGRNLDEENKDAEQSICPKGWHLPISGSNTNNEWKRSDFYTLASAYGANLENRHYDLTKNFFNNAGPGTAANFILAGDYANSSSFQGGGSSGLYWTSTSSNDTYYARSFYYYSTTTYSVYRSPRNSGFSVRCLISSPLD